MASSRSRGESMMRQPITPTALQPKPMHMDGLFQNAGKTRILRFAQAFGLEPSVCRPWLGQGILFTAHVAEKDDYIAYSLTDVSV